MRYFIVDDDAVSRRMLSQIIIDGDLGIVVGEADNGEDAIAPILLSHPDFVLIDLLMPKQDGIMTIEQLHKENFKGHFVMISQVVDKDMVSEAYSQDVEFFIHKPINKNEVTNVLKKTAERYLLKQSLLTIRDSLVHFEKDTKEEIQLTVKDIVLSILNDLGIVGQSGSDDIVAIIEMLSMQQDLPKQLPPLKNLYENLAATTRSTSLDIAKEAKAIEQRIRRAVITATQNIAIMGAVDYASQEFEYYAPRYFEFAEVRLCMQAVQKEQPMPKKIKVNIKKFLQVLAVETKEKYYQ